MAYICIAGMRRQLLSDLGYKYNKLSQRYF